MARGHSTIKQILLKIIPERTSLAIAVSGGKDSISLLHAIVSIRTQKKLNLTVLHVNHGLRGKDSNGDADFVKKLAIAYDCKCFVKKLLSPPKQNIEAWGRVERYNFFKKMRLAHKIDWILTAHTANDLTETHLMRLLANKELGNIEAHDNERKLLRPFLTVERKMIDSYAKEHSLAWREDSSNQDTGFLRNKIRQTVLPFLEKELGKNHTLRLAERLAELAQKEGAISAMAEKLIRDTKLGEKAVGTKAWVTCLRNIINAIDYTSLKLAVVHSAFGETINKNGPRNNCLSDKGAGGRKGKSPGSSGRRLQVRASQDAVSRNDCKNLLAWLERKAQAVTLPHNRVLRGYQGGFKITIENTSILKK